VDGQKTGKRIGSANSRMDENVDSKRTAERITSELSIAFSTSSPQTLSTVLM